MGKIRVKTLGDESVENEQKKQSQKRQKAKKEAKDAAVEEEVIEVKEAEEEKKEPARNASPAGMPSVKPMAARQSDAGGEKKTSKYKEKNAKKSSRSKRYMGVKAKVEKRAYNLSEALKLLPELKLSKFDETVELHINTTEPGITGSYTLPHGSGKTVRVVVANDAVIEEISKGKINFDVLLAEPAMMAKLAKVAKVLGPKGLMPNPKNGTVTTKPEDEMKKYQGGHSSFKTESKIPVVHLVVGKLSFGEDKLSENIKVALQAVQASRIRNVTLKSTMSPAIKISL